MLVSLLKQQLETLPTNPGVYIYKDTKGNILYVGKAKVLRSRVRSYFARSGDELAPSPDLEPSKVQMVRHIATLETISTDTENEALILEANLIRKHQPPYNVVLRDDKFYLFIKVTKEELPRVFPTRRIHKDGGRYFGPYSSARSVRATLKLLRRIFPFRGEKDSPREFVFPHPLFSSTVQNTSGHQEELGSEDISQEEKLQYQENIRNIIRFLQGDRAEIIETIRQGMKAASKEQNYERAAIFRDQLQAVERLEGFQKVYLPTKESFDVISIARQKTRSAANVFQIREGKLLNKNTFLLQHRTNTPLEDTLRQFLLQYYGVAQNIPDVILVPAELSDQAGIAEWIRVASPPTLAVPQRGKKRQLLLMGETNAQQFLDEQEAVFESTKRLKEAEQQLFTAVGIKGDNAENTRIETYDISNIQGNLATASMVVFIDGKPDPSQYRKFRMHFADKPNDFAMMQEVLTRRFKNHLQSEDPTSPKRLRGAGWKKPNLIVIDGGKGQLSSAKKVLDELAPGIPVISIAKREEEIFIPERADSIRLPYDSDALYLIQRMRDEAHRFTITYHRLLRSKQQKRSILDEVPGIGPKTKKRLINHFGSLKGIRSASDEELIKVIGAEKTRLLRDFL